MPELPRPIMGTVDDVLGVDHGRIYRSMRILRFYRPCDTSLVTMSVVDRAIP